MQPSHGFGKFMHIFIQPPLYNTLGKPSCTILTLTPIGQRIRCNLRQHSDERSHLYLCGALHRNGKLIVHLWSVAIFTNDSKQAVVAALMPFEPYGKRSM